MNEKISKLTVQQRKSQKTKNRIYKTAVRMLSKYEFDNLTVRNICDEAGVSTGTFYYYFKSKEDLWGYYLIDGLMKYADKHPLEYTSDITKYVLDVYDLYLNYCQETGIVFLSHYYSTTNKQLARTYEGATNRPVSMWIRSGVEKSKAENIFPSSIDTESFIDEICTIIKGCIFEWCVSDGSFDLVEHANKLLYHHIEGILLLEKNK